ncbi:MAG: response regulator [Acidobacteria bacterium]|nr:response regulator [Acidobacteriota bacterium]
MSKRKILLADDSITIQKVVNLTFAEEGVEVVTVGDGDSALARVAEEWPDLIMADVNMPGASGYKVCETIRADQATRDIPVILLVGSFEPFDEAEAERVGANAFLTKPFQSIRQLVAQVTDLMASSAKSEPEQDVIEIPDGLQDTDVVEKEDVESLYQESLSGDKTIEEIASEEYFGDQSLDDEMIETSVTEPEVAEDTLEFGYNEPDVEVQSSGSNIETDDLSVGEIDEVSAPSIVSEQPAEQQTSYDDASEDPLSFPAYEAPVTQDTNNVVQSDPGYVSSPRIEELSARTYVDPFLETIAPVRAPETQPLVSLPSSEVSLPSADVREEALLQDLDLLDLPPVGAEPHNLVTQEQAQSSGAGSRAISLSPELIDLIVDKVIERLRERG